MIFFPKPNVMIVIATDIIGGPGKGLLQFLRFADRRRFDFLLCNYDRAGRNGFRSDFLNAAAAQGLVVHRFHQRATIDPLLIAQALRTIRKNRIDIVQTHSYKSNILGCLLKLLYNMPWIAFAHGYTGENNKIALYNRLDLMCYKYADLAVVVSEPLKRLLHSNGVDPRRIVKLPNAVDRKELVAHGDPQQLRRDRFLPADGAVIAVIGRLSPEKGQLVFLQAFRKIKARMAHATALIVGDGPEKPRLMQYCRDHGLAQNVVFTGHVTNVGNYYRMADLLVIPSYSEGLPNVLLEAMALGVPVIATRVGAVGEVLQGMDAAMVPPGDSAALAERMRLFLGDPSLAQETARQGRRTIALRYDPIRRAENLVALYYRVLRGRRWGV